VNFPDPLLPTNLLWAANAFGALTLLHSARKADWRTLATPLLHVFLGACVALGLLWSIKAGIKPGLNFHVLGATLLTLMFGPYLALIAMALVLLLVTLAGAAGMESYGINFLLMALLPVGISYAIFRWADRKLPNHFFVYVMVDGFFAAALAMALLGFATCFILAEAGAYTTHYLRSEYLPFYMLMAWSEALLTGMAATLMAAYRPEWLATFDDRRYLKTKR
jgi:uncharacterized membrane protein